MWIFTDVVLFSFDLTVSLPLPPPPAKWGHSGNQREEQIHTHTHTATLPSKHTERKKGQKQNLKDKLVGRELT